MLCACSATRDKKTGRFKDSDLANALQSATAVPAAAFKARGVPSVMRVVEIMGQYILHLIITRLTILKPQILFAMPRY